MGKRILFASTALVLLGGFGTQAQTAPQAARADSCLSAPGGTTPKGQHWYYRLDRATGGKCWYLRDLITSSHKPAASASAANAKAAPEDDVPRSKAVPAKPAAQSRATTPDAPRQAVRQSPASQVQSPWPEAPPKIAPVRSVPSASEAVSDSAPASDASPSKRNELRSADASGAVPIPNPKTAAPGAGSDQGTASSVWTDPPPAPKGEAVRRSVEPQTQSMTGTQNHVETKDSVSQSALPAQPAQPAAAATSGHGALMENTLVFTSATILAGLAFFAFMLMRHRLLAFARKGQFAHRLRTMWLQARSKLSVGRKGMQVPLVPEQVTMGRPYFGRREQEVPRHSYEHHIK